jgi:hypothetical protein
MSAGVGQPVDITKGKENLPTYCVQKGPLSKSKYENLRRKRFEVASKDAGLGLEKMNVWLLVLVDVSDGALKVYGGLVKVLVPRSGQRYDMTKAIGSHTILPSENIPAVGESDGCSVFSSLLF